MPQLPSGRHVGIDPAPLHDLLQNAEHFGNVHKVLAIKTTNDVLDYVEVVFLVPAADAGTANNELHLGEGSLPAPPGMVCISSGSRLANWEAEFREWPEDDKRTFRELLESRAAPTLQGYLAVVENVQAQLRASPDFLTKVLSAWWDHGLHPAQEVGWDESDVGYPEWDDYDMLAALGQACSVLPENQEIMELGQDPLWMLQAYWNMVRSHVTLKPDSWPDPGKPVRACSGEARQNAWLDRLTGSERDWLRKNGISICVTLWNAYGENLKTAVPQAYGIIELVVVSEDANRFFPAQHQK